MAKVILESTDTQYTIANNNVEVKGASGNQTIVVNSGVTGLSLDSTIEDVDFAGNVADFTFSQDGAGNLTVLDSSGNAIATVSGANGKTLSFTDGTVALETTFDATTGTGGINLGGTAVGTTAAAVVPATIDATDVSTATDTTAPVTGETFTLSTSTTTADSVIGTSGSDTVDGSTTDSLQSGDLIVDSSTTDADVLNATVSTTTTNPTISNVETVNLTAKYGSAGLDLANVSGVNTVNLNSDIVSGSATFTNVASSKVSSFVAGTNITSLSVTSATTGTVGTVAVDLGTASAMTLVGDATQADLFDVVVNGGTTALTQSNMDDSGDSLTLNSSGSSANTVTFAAGAVKTIVAEGSQALTLSGAGTAFNGATITDSTDANLTLSITGTAGTADLSKATVDTIQLGGTGALGSYTVANNANVALNTTGATTLTAGSGATDVNVALGLATANVTNTTLTTVNVAATTIDVTNADLKVGAAATIILSGDKNVTVAATSTAKALDASALTGKLTISVDGTADIATITGGSGNDSVTTGTLASALTISTGAGDDTVTLGVAVGANKQILDAGAGTDTLKVTATQDFSAATARESVITGFETLDVNGQTVTLTQLQLNTNGGFAVADTAGSGTLAIADDTTSPDVYDLSGLTFSAGIVAPTITVAGSSAGDTITGSSAADQITAGDGADTLTGNGGRDGFIIGTAGHSDTTSYDKISDFGLVATAFGGATDIATYAKFKALSTGGTNADFLQLATTATLGGAETVDVSTASGNAGKTISAVESAAGIISLTGADAALVDTLAEWLLVASTVAGANADAVAFEFSGSTYVFQQHATDDELVELTGVTGVTGIELATATSNASVGEIILL